jgi:hypothetical protein
MTMETNRVYVGSLPDLPLIIDPPSKAVPLKIVGDALGDKVINVSFAPVGDLEGTDIGEC